MGISLINSSGIVSVANTAITGNIISSQIASVSGSVITANTVANSAFQTGSVENYMNSAGLSFGMRNRIINGAMVIDQRNAGAAVTVTDAASSFFGVDRFYANRTNGYSLSTSTIQQVSDAPSGFIKSVKYTNSTAETPTSALYSNLQQYIEGLNVADLGWGASGAKPATLSFWVKISVTGTFGGTLRSGAADVSYPFSFSYNSANTWQFVSIGIPGPTSGTFYTTNGVGFSVNWDLGVGPSLSASATGAWQAVNAIGLTGGIKLNSTAGATYQITGVQLEKGSTATSFDYRPYGTELALCQRYFYLTNPSNASKNGGAWGSMYSGNTAHLTGPLPVAMRAAPTYTFGGSSNTYYISNINGASSGSPQNPSASPLIIDFEVISLSGGATGYPVQFNGQLSITAEL